MLPMLRLTCSLFLLCAFFRFIQVNVERHFLRKTRAATATTTTITVLPTAATIEAVGRAEDDVEDVDEGTYNCWVEVWAKREKAEILDDNLYDASNSLTAKLADPFGTKGMWKNQEIQRVFADINQKCFAGQFYDFLFHEIVNMKPVKNLLIDHVTQRGRIHMYAGKHY